MAIQISTLTLDEFMQRYSDEGPFEFVEGEFITMSPQTTRSGRVAGNLFRELSIHVIKNHLGEAFIEVPFVLTLGDPNWVKGSRVPDVMFVSRVRLEQLAADNPDWQDNPIVLVPDFVAEIISPTDRFSDVSSKVARYLDDGVKLIWVIDPQQSATTIYCAGSDQHTTLRGGGMLDAGEVIPGFKIDLKELFGD